MSNNAEQLKLKFAKAWEDDGAARREIRKFLHKYAWTFWVVVVSMPMKGVKSLDSYKYVWRK